MEIYPFDYSRLNRDLGVKGDDFKKYLISEKYIETESKTIKDLAEKSAPKRSKGGILLHSIFNSTIKNLDKYSFANDPKGALGALRLGEGIAQIIPICLSLYVVLGDCLLGMFMEF